jgi:hypothetical protein
MAMDATHPMLTYSEMLFERYCTLRGLNFERVPVAPRERTPDYIVRVERQTLICEVTELTPNAADMSVGKALKLYGFAGLYELAGRRVLLKGHDKKTQLKAAWRGEFPGMIVFCQQPDLGGEYLTGDHFEAAMYGHATRSRLPDRIPLGHDGHGLCTPSRGIYISALASLHISAADELKLTIYHNLYAARPLDRNGFRAVNDRQFVKNLDGMDGPWGWVQMSESEP